MSAPFTTTLGELRVTRTIEDDAVLPCVEAVHADGRVLRARALPLSEGIDADVLTRFDASVRAASAIAHPSVATPRVWSVSPPFVAVDAIDGVGLAAIATTPLRAEDVIAIGADVAEALEAAHAGGAVHGGVSIRAIVLARSGHAVLSDFAIAGLAASLADAHSHLLEAVAAHLTPEQLEAAPTTTATDVFSLGVTLYRLLTGVYPFDAPSPMGMTLKLSMGSYERLDAVVPAAPVPLTELVHRALAPTPADRPSARDVAVALLALAPREEARRGRIRGLLPAPVEASRAPISAAGPHGAGPHGAAAPAHPSPPAASVSPASAPLAHAIAAPSPPSAAPLPAPSAPMEWVESARFDEASTEFTPELEAAIARDAGISNMPVLAPSTRTAAPIPTMPVAPARPLAREERSVVVYVVIAAAALVVLVGAVLGAIALVD